eukprot:TRINITY_DN2309_c0_g1_i2.p1 TRINITY_DN2309_c0_g1~~TRINITY_DN2309_c0_g1_i2.p1  ORF type:complete len:247 (+),score=47.07 TRINITY_DN2309_c0_g1_i2:306-1046(+)
MEDQLQEQQQQLEQSLLQYIQPVEIQAPDPMLSDPLEIKKKSQLPPLDSKPSIEDILNKIFLPKQYQLQNRWFQRNVSCEEASRTELTDLEDQLDHLLKERQARKSGICPVREDLHNQLFDEIIRQCTINSPERGLLLLRVRNNLRMTFAAYQTLYQGSIVFGVKKAKQAEEGQQELEQKSEELKKKKIYLTNRKIILENELDSIEKSFNEIRGIEKLRREQEMSYLKQQTKHLEIFLKTVQSNVQ